MKIKTIEQAKELGLFTYSYKNGDWEYRDADGYCHLIRNGEELLPKVKKLYIHLYDNGDWEYDDTKGHTHLIKVDKRTEK